jgi:hypothetical protein
MPAVFFASTKAGGNCFAMPDVCLTPAPPAPSPVPIPYPNTGMVNQATKTTRKVKILNKPVLTTKSEISRSNGDEAGVNKGVMSGMNMGKITYKMGSSGVKMEGTPCARLTSVTGHNGMNANNPAGAQVAPSQTKVRVSP